MHEHQMQLQAPEDAALHLWLEPWAEGLVIPPGGIVEVSGTSAIPGGFEVETTPESTTLYAWVGATVQVSMAGKVVLAFTTPVPGTPEGMSIRQLTTMLFGPPPVPDREEEGPL